jgi:phosphopantothenoylcysteine decarboxylase / phosphopantothenate---cysteine ligase
MNERLDLAGRHVVLGLSGGIACYKSAELVRAIVKAGGTVQVVMSEAAEHFITPVTMQALSNRKVYSSQWDVPTTCSASCAWRGPSSVAPCCWRPR